MEDETEKKMLEMLERHERGEEISEEDLQRLLVWYNDSVNKLQDDIKITKIKKELGI